MNGTIKMQLLILFYWLVYSDIFWKCPQINAMAQYWSQSNIYSGKDFVPSGL